jgi:hypothetical protein
MFANLFYSRRTQNPAVPSGALSLRLELLETREMPAVVTVDVGQVVRLVDPQVLGVNLDWWDSHVNTVQTQQLVQAAGLTMFRLGGGSSTDQIHFNTPSMAAASMASLIASVGGNGMVTLDYGSGSPQEAAAYMAYLNAPVGSDAVIGHGEEWSDSLQSWKDVDWQTAGYWAGLRAAAPLAHDDGLNFLRLNRPAPFGFHYFEVGNEVYGSWETDHHGQGGDPGKPHDPATYVAFAQQFATLAASIDPTIAIGVDSGSDGVHSYTYWLASVLRQGVSQRFIPTFISDHSYMQAPGQESDSYLLLDTVSDPKNQDLDWSSRASGYHAVLQQMLGSEASRVELLATEYNSVYSNPGKQTTSLVNGLFVADSIGSLLQTQYDGADVWDLRNGWDTSNNNSSGLYGWREGGDYGLLGSGNVTLPSSGTYVPYPSYFAEQLLSKMLHSGDTVVRAVSNDANLSVYSVLEQNGHLDLLVINKSPASDLTGQFQLNGFEPDGQARLWQYGKAQDTAQSQTADGHSALASFTDTLVLNGSSFSYTFPAYSVTVLDLLQSVAATALQLGVPPGSTAGAAFNFTVTARDSSNNVATGYRGTIHFTSTDGQAILPGDYTFQDADNGTHTFSGTTLYTTGTWDITATDPSAGIMGSGSVSVTPAPASQFRVVAPSTVVSTTPFDVTVLALDPYGNVDINYQGTIGFSTTDSDPGVLLPANYTFTTNDAGVHTFTAGATLVTPGDQTILVSDTGGLTGSTTITVTSPPAPPGARRAPGPGLDQEAGMGQLLQASLQAILYSSGEHERRLDSAFRQWTHLVDLRARFG